MKRVRDTERVGVDFGEIAAFDVFLEVQCTCGSAFSSCRRVSTHAIIHFPR